MYVSPPKPYSASKNNLHRISVSCLFRNHLKVCSSRLKSPVLRISRRKYRRSVMYPSFSKCNANTFGGIRRVTVTFLICYESDFMLSLSDNNQADCVEAFNSTSRYRNDKLNIDNPYFAQISQICPAELQLIKTNPSNIEALFLDLDLSITNDIVSTKFMIDGTALIKPDVSST